MATTRIIPMHLNKGKSIKQCLSDCIDYDKNSDKPDRICRVDVKNIARFRC